MTAALRAQVSLLIGARDEHIAGQELNPLNVNARELPAVFAIGRTQKRSPERRMISPSRTEMGMNVMGDVID